MIQKRHIKLFEEFNKNLINHMTEIGAENELDMKILDHIQKMIENGATKEEIEEFRRTHNDIHNDQRKQTIKPSPSNVDSSKTRMNLNFPWQSDDDFDW